MVDWSAVVTSSVAGSLVTLGVQWLTGLRNKARLVIIFNDSERGCYADEVEQTDRSVRKYLRVKVTNEGRTLAKDVRVLFTGFTSGTIVRNDVLDAYWANAPKGRPHLIDIPSKTSRYADVVWTDLNPDKAYLTVCASGSGSNLGVEPNAYGNFSIEAVFAAENAATVEKVLHFSYNGTADSLKIG